MNRARPLRRGLNFLEVLVIVAIMGIVVLFVLMRMPRSRESARDVTCKKNLMQIGVALAQYHSDAGNLPTAFLGGPGPLRACLGQLAIPDFVGLTDAEKRKPTPAGFVMTEKPVAGFFCPTDTNSATSKFAAPINYRASTGDTPDGQGGAFALGKLVKFGQVDAKDGLAFTAAFSERLVGDGASPAVPNLAAMRVCPGPIAAAVCPDAPGSTWASDSGSSWWTASWASSLYNHALPPNANPNCRSDDGKTALVSASSMHPTGVNVLLLDGGVRSYSTRVDPKIWRSLGSVDEGVPTVPSAPVTPTPKAP